MCFTMTSPGSRGTAWRWRFSEGALTENASRDVGIAFANELSVICDQLGINVWELIRLANHLAAGG